SERLGICGPEPPVRPQLPLFPSLVDETPDVRRRQIGVAEAGVAHEVAWVGWASILLEIGGCCDEIAAHATKPPRPQRGIRQRGDAQGGVEALPDQVDELIAQMKIDRNFRVLGKKLR